MQTFKCKFCDGEIEFEKNSNICVCPYCDSKISCSEDGVFIGWNPELIDSNTNAQVDFAMSVDRVFALRGEVVSVVGNISHGAVSVNDCIRIYSDNGEYIECTVLEIEQIKKKLDCARKGESVGLILSDVDKSQINNGDILIKGDIDFKALNERIIRYYVPTGDRAGAVKFYMQTTGLGLKEAKIKVDMLFR